MRTKRNIIALFVSVLFLTVFIGAGTPSLVKADPDIQINEIRIDQPSTDNDEYFELSGGASETLDGLTYIVIGDGTGGSGVIEAVVALSGNSVGSSGFFVAAEGTFSLGTADLTTNLNFENSDNVTHLLVRDFSGSDGDDLDTDDDGTLDSSPWSELIDCLGLVETVGSGELVYCSTTLGPDGSFVPGHAHLCAEGWQIGEFDLGVDDSPGAANICEPQTSTGLVINEIDYDQPGTDTAEFIEIKNTSAGTLSLAGVTVELVNGSNDTVYDSITLPAEDLAAGEYFVVCGNSANTPDCDLDVEPSSNLIQNGSPDAAALMQGSEVLDAVSYEGDVAPPYVEGSGVGLEDDSSIAHGGISRFPDGADTDQNNVDLSFRCITPGGANAADSSDCVPPVVEECGAEFTPIYDIQGSGSSSPIEGMVVSTEGVVTADFTAPDRLGGFNIQDEVGDGDPATSDGIFVFAPGSSVAEGDRVRVRGTVDEFFGLTQINDVVLVQSCGVGSVIEPTVVMMPVSAIDDWEWTEGMLIKIDQELSVSDNFNWGRFGELLLSVNGRLFNPTNVTDPGAPANAMQDLNNRSSIQLDDASTVQNPLPLPPFIGPENTVRAGDTTPSLTGVLGYSFGAYEVLPTSDFSFERINERVFPAPDLGGNLTIASFNVLNYFTTIDNGDPICGPNMDQGCRGADTPEEFVRQRDKIIDAILGMDADIIGLIELENNTSESLADLVSGLNDNAGAGTYAYLDTGTIGSDAIKVGLIYQPDSATPVGDFAVLDSSVDPTFNDEKNRPVLAQTFMENSSGEVVTVAVNHLKSKGSPCDDVGDPDLGDGQGNCNVTRTNAAIAQANWLAGDPTGSGDRDFLIIGDLNSYAMEDPITALKDLDYTNLVDVYEGLYAYSFVFFGQAGYLDHALSTPNMTAQVLDLVVWHINADEPRALDYNNFNQPDLYNPDAYRSSDHDPVIAHVNLTPYVTNEDGCYILILEGSPYTGAGTIVYRSAYQSFNAVTWANQAGLPVDSCFEIHGSDYSEKIRGGIGDDVFFGYGGADGLVGDRGDDTFTGHEGADFFIGGPGIDTVTDYEPGIDECSRIEIGCNPIIGFE